RPCAWQRPWDRFRPWPARRPRCSASRSSPWPRRQDRSCCASMTAPPCRWTWPWRCSGGRCSSRSASWCGTAAPAGGESVRHVLHVAAVHVQVLPHGETRDGARQEHDGGGHFLRRSQPPDDALLQRFAVRLRHFLPDVVPGTALEEDGTWRDDVHADPFRGERLAELRAV